MGEMDHGGGVPSVGELGSTSEVDRIFSISLLDTPVLDPASILVTAGETIRFEITNDGAANHEFVLGTEAAQDEHATEMDDMRGTMESGDDNAAAVPPGATETLIWTFDQQGTVLYGCHMADHFEAGMVGEITVQA